MLTLTTNGPLFINLNIDILKLVGVFVYILWMEWIVGADTSHSNLNSNKMLSNITQFDKVTNNSDGDGMAWHGMLMRLNQSIFKTKLLIENHLIVVCSFIELSKNYTSV